MEATARGRSLQERFESSRAGRIVISVFVLVTMVVLVTANLPDSRLQEVLLKADRPYLYGLGLDQAWGVFAPDPRSQTIDISADVRFADGSHVTWDIPRRDPVIGEYTDYRWLKWGEYVVSPAHQELWKPIAAYLARQYASPTRRPVQVTMTNRWHDLQPPGQIPDHPFDHLQTVFTMPVTPEMLGGS